MTGRTRRVRQVSGEVQIVGTAASTIQGLLSQHDVISLPLPRVSGVAPAAAELLRRATAVVCTTASRLSRVRRAAKHRLRLRSHFRGSHRHQVQAAVHHIAATPEVEQPAAPTHRAVLASNPYRLTDAHSARRTTTRRAGRLECLLLLRLIAAVVLGTRHVVVVNEGIQRDVIHPCVFVCTHVISPFPYLNAAYCAQVKLVV